MSPAPGLVPGLAQRLTLAPRLAESLRLLAMPAVELADVLEAELEANPLLERAETAGEDYPEAGGGDEEQVEEWEPAEWPSAPATSEVREEPPEPAADEDLQSHLARQLALERLSERDHAIALVIVNAVDDDGYLRESPSDLAAALSELDPPVGTEEIEAVIRRVQTLEPTGVGARTPAECLLLQLRERAAHTPGLTLAQRLLGEHFERLAEHDGERLCRLAGCSPQELDTALALIRSLDPHPGYRLAPPSVEYLVPELTAAPAPGGWRVEMNPHARQRLAVNETYAAWLDARRGSEETESPLLARLEEARWLIRSLAQRDETLLRVGRELVSRQAAFLNNGPADLAPLTLRDIADSLDMHESTVSRAVQYKSIATPRGIIPLRDFFSVAIARRDGGQTSAAAVRDRIRDLIRSEDAGKPLSDAALADALRARGVEVARRTVAKYRETLGFASARERKNSRR